MYTSFSKLWSKCNKSCIDCFLKKLCRQEIISAGADNSDKFHPVKGLCKETKVDTEYLLLGYEVLGTGRVKRKYGGSTGWLLAHDKERDLWQLRHHHYPFLTISMEDKDSLPVGIHQWVVANDTCNLGQTTRF